jgi:hypothetical protein
MRISPKLQDFEYSLLFQAPHLLQNTAVPEVCKVHNLITGIDRRLQEVLFV